jgi:hypothetical protein
MIAEHQRIVSLKSEWPASPRGSSSLLGLSAVIVRPLVPASTVRDPSWFAVCPYESKVLPFYARAIGPQPHRNSIEVFCPALFRDRYGALEGAGEDGGGDRCQAASPDENAPSETAAGGSSSGKSPWLFGNYCGVTE